MKIGLNAIEFSAGRLGGLETYFRNLLHYLQVFDTKNEYTVLCNDKNMDFMLSNSNFKIKKCSFTSSEVKRLLRKMAIKTIDMDFLRAEPKYLKYDIVHHPFTTMDLSWDIIPSVLTFWDMQHEFHPEFFSAAELCMRNRTYHASARVATRIIVCAEFTKRCLIEKYGVIADKIDVIHTGIGDEYHLISDLEKLQEIKIAYGLNRPFMYYPAATWPHKNHLNLLKMLRLMKDRRHFDGDLVLTGIAQKSHQALLAEIEKMGLGDYVKVLGYLPYEDLPYLYNLARLMVFPSLFEGFGIPLIEAMACGCPVAASNLTSVPEIVGIAGVSFDPYSPEDMAEKVGHAWNDDEKLRSMMFLGLERAKCFNWEHVIRKTIEVYRKAASDRI